LSQIAYLKTEPVLVALMGLAFLGDSADGPRWAWRFIMAMAGVSADLGEPAGVDWRGKARTARPVIRGAVRGFGHCYRGAILSLHAGNFVLASTFSLAVGLTLQTLLLLTWACAFQFALKH